MIRAGITGRLKRLALGGALAALLAGGAGFAGVHADPASVGLERAGTRGATSSTTREPTIDGAHAVPATVGLARAGTRTASSAGSREST